MSKLFIPELGTRLLLTEDWDFDIHVEYRNNSFFETLGYNINGRYNYNFDELRNQRIINPIIERGEWDYNEIQIQGVGYGSIFRTLKKKVCLPVGTVLTVDRIYIRKGNEEFNSVSFNLNYCPEPSFCPKNGFKSMGGKNATIPLIKGEAGRIRFWVKLEDINSNLTFDENFKGDFTP